MWVFPELSANSDEGVYLYQADALASGDLHPAVPDAPGEAFLPWFSVQQGGRYVLKYTPVYAGVLAGGAGLFGTPRASLALIAAAAVTLVVLLSRELGADRRGALFSGAVFLASPLFLLLSITFLPYLMSLGLLMATATAALRSCRLGSRAMGLVAGLMWGVALFARPYDAVLGGLAIALTVGIRERHSLRRLMPLLPWAVLGTAGPVLALLAFNRSATGSAFQLPFNILESLDTVGFGPRRALPSDPTLDYTPGLAFQALGRNLVLIVAWTGGSTVTLTLASIALWRRRLAAGSMLVGLVLVWLVGYWFFWGSYLTVRAWDGALFLGPYYYLPVVAAISIAGGVGLADLVKRRRSAGVVAGVAALALSIVILVPVLSQNLERSSNRAAVADAVDATISEPALVFVPQLYGPYIYNPLSFLRNDAGVGGEIVYALDRGESANALVRSAYPGRSVYRLDLLRGWSDQPEFVPAIEVIRLADGEG